MDVPNGIHLPNTPSPSPETGDPLISHAVSLLAHHGMRNLNAATDRLPPSIMQAVRHALSTSFTEMSPRTANRLTSQLAQGQLRNTLSLFFQFWSAMYKPLSYKRVDGAGFEEIDWARKGLEFNVFQRFQGTGIDLLDPPSPEELFVRLSEILVPKPGIAFGFSENVRIDMPSEGFWAKQSWDAVSDGIHHPFLLVEWQPPLPSHSVVEAEIRALRAGSILIEAHRYWKEKAGMLGSQQGPESSTIVFSFCVCFGYAQLYVHWAFDGSSRGGQLFRTLYFMKEVKFYPFEETDCLKDMRQDLERILDWGSSTRLNGPGGIREMVARLNEIPEV